MESRVTRLEVNVEHMVANVSATSDSLADARERLARLEVKVDHLPSKGFIVTALLVLLTVITALVGYADTVKKLLPGAD